MEVHHHPDLHHKKKKFKEYFLEFLMIFLAVTMGFFAESIREKISDNAKEKKEYIISMIEDAETDTANLQKNIALNTARSKRLDTLATFCLNYDISGNDDENIHRLYKYGLKHPDFVTPTERTIQQLKNAGGMRLIRKKTAVDSIVLYDDMTKKLSDQQAYYELYQNKTIEIGAQIINFQNLGWRKNSPPVTHFVAKDSSIKLINRDKLKLIEFGNMIDIYQGVVQFYIVRLQEMNEHAIHLIQTLKKEYHLEKE